MPDLEVLGGRGDGLARTLRELRKQAGLTGERLGARCAISQSKISKIETGRIIPSVVDVERILYALGVPADVLNEVTALARLANTEFQDVRSLMRKGLEKKQSELSSLEAATTDFRFFLPAMIGALISTPEYIRASLAHIRGDTRKAVAKKLERQAVLYDTSKTFSFVLTESAVRWPVCPSAAMATQLDRLVSLSYLPNIQLGVIPVVASTLRGPLNTFTVYDRRLVTAETFTGALVMRDPHDVTAHLDLFAAFAEAAIFADAARDRLSEWAVEFRCASALNLCEYENDPSFDGCAALNVFHVPDLSGRGPRPGRGGQGLGGTGLVADDIYLMAHHEMTGKPLLRPRVLGLGLAGALLAELMLAGTISLGLTGLVVTSRAVPQDLVTRHVLTVIISEREPHPTRDWLQFVARTAAEDVAVRLADAGYLTRTSRGGLWRSTRWVPVEADWAFAPLVRVRAALNPAQPPHPYAATLTGLAVACGLGFRLAQYAHGRSVEETVAFLKPDLRELIAETQAAVDSALLSNRA
jgi:transcriptional regulator with XRE-family HTH domain